MKKNKTDRKSKPLPQKMQKQKQKQKHEDKNTEIYEKISPLVRLRQSKYFFAYVALSIIIIIGGVAVNFQLNTRREEANAERGMAYEEMAGARDELEAENMRLFETKLEGAFTEKNLTAMVEQFVEYELFVNNRKIDDSQTIFYSQTPSIRVTFYERFGQEAMKLFPEKILMETSKVREQYLNDQILISTTLSELDEVKTQLTPQGIRTDYNFTGVKSGEIITLDLSFEFSKLIKLADASLEIFYNVATGEGDIGNAD